MARREGQRRWRSLRGTAGLVALAATIAVGLAFVPGALGHPVTGAFSTTTNPAFDNGGTGSPVLCENGPGNTTPSVNCNIYTDKKYVWISGLPGPADLADGTYFFVVLVPGGQNNDVADGNPKNLSSPYDPYTNREFIVSGGTITNLGSHTYDPLNNLLNLFPYADTTNPGGEYTVGVCMLGPDDTSATVNPDDCKYDNFKVKTGTTIPPAADLTVTKDAVPSFSRQYGWDVTKSVDSNTANIPAGGTATFTYTVSVTHDNGTDGNWKVSGTITVSNPNAASVDVSSIADTVDNGGTCTVDTSGGLTVPGPGVKTYPYECIYGPAGPSPLAGTNTVTVSWDDQTLSDGSVLAGNSASGSAAFDFGTAVPTIVDGSVDVSDTFGGSLGSVLYTDPSPTTFTYPHDFTGDPAGTCTKHDNTATISIDNSPIDSASQSVTVCVGADLTVSKTANATLTRTYKWLIDKSVDQTQINIASGGTATFNYGVKVTPDGYVDSSWALSGTITLTNPNDFEAITVTSLSDTLDVGGTCTVDPGLYVVPASGSLAVGYSCTTDGTTTKNTATAAWDNVAASTPTGTASGDAPVSFVVKDEVNKTITVVDDKTDPLNPVTLGTWVWADGEHTFTYSLDKQGVGGTCTNYTNVATISETGQSDSQKVTVCVGADLTVGKTATPSFKRAYTWAIGKAVDKTLVEQIGGGTATFNYTVNASQTGFTDSDWAVNGTITVSNPNDWEDITVNVSDLIDNGGTCVVTGGSNLLVPKSSSATATYTCTYASAPPAAFTNTATAAWNNAAFFTPTGSASGSAAGAFGAPTTTVNKTITVTDTFNSITTTLGTLTGTDATPFASATYTYSHIVNVPAHNCVKYTNTAVIVETGQSASQTVEVCGPAATGALTMGYWQNKNGQANITAANQTNLKAYLMGFAPFQDIGTTAVNVYVTNVIKAANASGASMNAMLKAQMLATALDVYFSTSGLGGVSIDLTMINKPIGSGTFENVSSSFNNQTSMTVSAMLSWAASQSNAGGSVWYGQVKNGPNSQELAKDAFDAINNQVAFAP
jgi:hypothetical protein